MPLYEYKCNDCDFRFEELISNANQKITCPKCQSQSISKLISVFSPSVTAGNTTTCGKSDCASGFG